MDVRLRPYGVVLTALLAVGEADAARGTHVRITTAQGPIHVWSPADYDRESAGIVVYVHGYFTDVDRAWKEHKLARQFAESGINALFIACEAPDKPDTPVAWTSVDALLDRVAIGLEEAVPQGRVIAVGHSAAFRTLTMWVEEDRLDTIVLVDALYGDMPQFRTWLDGSPDRRLIDVGVDTRRWTDALHASLPDTMRFDEFPRARAGKLEGARSARIVYVRSRVDHMRLVTGGIALPMLLRALTLPVVPGASREDPIRVH